MGDNDTITPEIGSFWKHRNGDIYTVIALANTRSTRPEEFPIHIIYEDINTKEIQTEKLNDWNKSMIKTEEPT